MLSIFEVLCPLHFVLLRFELLFGLKKNYVADPPVHTVVEMSEFRAIYDQVVQLARISRGRRGFCGIDCNKNEANNVDY